MKNLIVVAASVASIALVACGKREEMVGNQSYPAQVTSNMSSQVAAIKSCMEQGLSEETCVSVHKQMVAGTLTGSPSMSTCEAQYGAGQCGNVPVAHSDGSSGSIILPLVAAAAAGYLAHSLMSSNSMPSGVTVPQKSWLNNRPAVYQQAVTQNRQTASIIGKDVKPVQQVNSYAVKQEHAQKSVTVNGKQIATDTGKVPTPYTVPGAVKPTQVAPQAPAKVEYKAPTTAYVQQQRPAPVSTPPRVTYSPSYSPTSSSRSGKR